MNFCLGQHAQRLATAGDPPEEDTTRSLMPTELRERPTVDRGVGDDDIDDVTRQVEQLPVVDLTQPDAALAQSLDQRGASSGHRDNVAGAQGRSCIALQDLAAAADALDENSLAIRREFQRRDPVSNPLASGIQGIGAQLELRPGLILFRRAAQHLIFESAALVGEIDAHQFRGDL